MRVLPLILVVIISCVAVSAQQLENSPETIDSEPVSLQPLGPKNELNKIDNILEKEPKTLLSEDADQINAALKFRFRNKESREQANFGIPYVNQETRESIREFDNAIAGPLFEPMEEIDGSNVGKFNEPEESDKFHWKPAIAQSLVFLGIQHSFRLAQRKTITELDGPFFRDWGKSVRNLGGWRDGDTFVTNYLGHPMQGAVTGWIFVVNSDKSIKLEFGNSKEYWESRLKAMAWSAAWSAQFEIGPISEASIGNVGLFDDVGPNTMGWVDMVITPVAGTGLVVLEDIIDKYILRNWLEKKLTSRTRIKMYRTFFNPFQSFVNVLSLKKPWRRKNR